MEFVDFMMNIKSKTMEEVSDFMSDNSSKLEEFRDRINSIMDLYDDDMGMDATQNLLNQVRELKKMR